MSVLSDEIDQDPTGKGYAAFLPDQPGRVVELLNAKTETKLGLVDRTEFTLWTVETGMLAVIKDESEDKTSALRSSALAMIYVLLGASSGIDFSNPKNVQTLDAWASLGKLSPTNKDSLLAVATKPASRAEVLGLPTITEEILRNR
jgi:hypothetical protein